MKMKEAKLIAISLCFCLANTAQAQIRLGSVEQGLRRECFGNEYPELISRTDIQMVQQSLNYLANRYGQILVVYANELEGMERGLRAANSALRRGKVVFLVSCNNPDWRNRRSPRLETSFRIGMLIQQRIRGSRYNFTIYKLTINNNFLPEDAIPF